MKAMEREESQKKEERKKKGIAAAMRVCNCVKKKEQKTEGRSWEVKIKSGSEYGS